jgi:predicted amidohydrolase
MAHFSIAGVQMSLLASGNNLPAMRHRLEVLKATYPWVQMVLFSELAPFGHSLHYAQPMPGPAEAEFCSWAARHRIWLIPGSLYQTRDGKIYNTTPVIDPHGRVVARYSKLFPFTPYEQHVEPGTEFVLFEVPTIGVFGLSICYDMWFPETTRTLAALGAEVILHPTMTNTIDRDVELSIVRASAAMNQCFIFDINSVGEAGNGRSIICNPEGIVLHQAGTGEEIIPLEIDLDALRNSRKQGILGLGQPLKSFRDRKIQFPIYNPQARYPYLETLGPLSKMSISHAGIPDPHLPAATLQIPIEKQLIFTSAEQPTSTNGQLYTSLPSVPENTVSLPNFQFIAADGLSQEELQDYI